MLSCLQRTASKLSNVARFFSYSSITLAKPLPPRIKINDADVSISYLKGTGPGGQKINKTNSAVQLIHKPTGIVVKCQATRSQAHNAKTARSLLADRVEALEKGDQSRVALKAEAARKKKARQTKKTRRKYRELEGKTKGKEEVEEEEVEEEEVEEEEVEEEEVEEEEVEEEEVEIIWDDEVESKTEAGQSKEPMDQIESSKSEKPKDT